jgi:predicted Rossmann fold flavoprotein
MQPQKQVIIAGAGAAGIFAAINIVENDPKASVIILEKSSKVLAKVKISGGGRCNVTNICSDIKELIKNYPRGEKELKFLFQNFSTINTVKWFESRGVKLKAEADGRMFPVSDNSQTIIDCLLNECQNHNIKIYTNCGIKSFERTNDFITVDIGDQKFTCHHLLIATGGSPKVEGFEWLQAKGHTIVPPVPSLFTFNLIDRSITELAGLSVKDAQVKIAGTKLNYRGPLLITHWGFSGPAVLKLSAFGARFLNEKDYKYSVIVNWTGGYNENESRNFLEEFKALNLLKNVRTIPPFQLPKRLWEFICESSGIPNDLKWNNFSGKAFNKLVSNLIAAEFPASGKTTFKEEFVTCGGISLKDINLETMESKKFPGLFFAGEILDIDGITGGFNFQSAWTTAFVAAKGIAGK